jgi:hypothetical protein
MIYVMNGVPKSEKIGNGKQHEIDSAKFAKGAYEHLYYRRGRLEGVSYAPEPGLLYAYRCLKLLENTVSVSTY